MDRNGRVSSLKGLAADLPSRGIVGRNSGSAVVFPVAAGTRFM